MKAIVIDEYGGPETLQEREVETPGIDSDQVLVEIQATSINPIDWKVRRGYLKQMLGFQFPIILGWDAAGIIREVGANVKDFEVGDRVFTRPETTDKSTYAEYVAVDEELLAKMPESMSFEQGAAIPLAGLTAYQCLMDFAEMKEGDHVLIHAGSGGVGHLGIQLAKSYGAYVSTTASSKNVDFLKELGADHVINYENEDFSEVLSDVDFVLDGVGGDVLVKSYEVLKPGGKLASIVEPPNEEEAKERGVKASFQWLESNGKKLEEFARLFKSGEVVPTIQETLEFTEQALQEAHQKSEDGHVRGKLVVKVK
ncbi:NADP-dependent oxidoreductase [Salsuginibacillus kocurii]|uniref:NADP-dependent oxidoreductase n=1 Tax=Salsuginibacillus kocurii TaxID=427078 RepID=UPI0003795F31|nr:NADP-dependent oxidoreductase [Salsuginibacillus kocurii]